MSATINKETELTIHILFRGEYFVKMIKRTSRTLTPLHQPLLRKALFLLFSYMCALRGDPFTLAILATFTHISTTLLGDSISLSSLTLLFNVKKLTRPWSNLLIVSTVQPPDRQKFTLYWWTRKGAGSS